VRERLDAGLARAVRGHQRGRGERGERGDLQQVAAGTGERGQHRAGGGDRAEQVDFDHPVEGGRVAVGERTADGDAGVGHDHVEGAEAVTDLGRDLAHPRQIGDVRVPGLGPRTGRRLRVRRLRRPLEFLGFEADQRDVRAPGGEGARQ
jgi:hypothetical protein